MWLKEAHRRQMQKRTMTYYQTEKTEPILKIQHLILYRTFCCKDVFPVPEIYIYIYMLLCFAPVLASRLPHFFPVCRQYSWVSLVTAE